MTLRPFHALPWLLAACLAAPPLQAAIAFVDRTATSGLTTQLFGGYGASWGDFDGDGWPDIWISNHMYKPNLYINNRDGTFTERLALHWQGNPLQDAHGGAWADFDNDGDLDLIELQGVNEGSSEIGKPFYVNHNGLLTDEAAARGLNDSFGRGRTPLWLDWNNDGLLDVYLANYPRPQDSEGPTRLMLQQSDGSFAAAAGMTRHLKNFFAQLAFFDNAVHLVVQGGPYPVALHRLGDPTPLPVLMSPQASISSVFDVAVADFDGDGADDLFLLRTRSGASAWVLDPITRRRVDIDIFNTAVDQGVSFRFSGPARPVLRLYGDEWKKSWIQVGAAGLRAARNATVYVDTIKAQKYVEVALDRLDPATAGLVPESQRVSPGMYIGRLPDGQWMIDVRGSSGREMAAQILSSDAEISQVVATGVATSDLFMTPGLLFRRDGAFVQQASTWGLRDTVSCESVAAGDFDNDMDVDLYLACTDVLGNRENLLYENVGGSFVRVANAGGAATTNAGTGGKVSVADYDNDGWLDLLVTDGRGNLGYPFHFGRRFLLRNQGGSHHWVRFDLRGCQSNRDGIGARVLVTAGGRTQHRLQGGGMHNGVQDDRRLHFGLAQNTTIDTVTVQWPSGAVTNHAGLGIDQTHLLREDAACARP